MAPPLIPGIPQLPPALDRPPVALIASEAISSLLWQSAQVPPVWGVFDLDGNQVLFPDSVLEFDNRREFQISDYPVIGGSFADYNKVVRPFEVQIRVSKSGTQSDRVQFLETIDTLVESLDLFNVVTPERVYQQVNMTRYEVIRRGPKGAYFLTEVDLVFEQVIQTQAQFTTTDIDTTPALLRRLPVLPDAQSPAAQPVSNVGIVQPQTPDSAQQQIGDAALASIPSFAYGR